MLVNRETFDAPIPGENFLADTRNQPWRRPPEYDNPDDFMKYVDKTFRQKHTQEGLDTLISNGVSITTMTDMFISRSIMDGLITIDFGVLLAGPTAKAIELMCVQLGIDYEMGFENTAEVPSSNDVQHLAMIMERDGLVQVAAEDEEDEMPPTDEAAEPEQDMGLMAPEADLMGDTADEQTQAEMLGMNAEEGPEDELR